MLQYFNEFFVNRIFGIGYIVTGIIFCIGLIITFEKISKNKKRITELFIKCFFIYLGDLFFSSFYYMMFGINKLDFFVTLVMTLLVASISKSYSSSLKLVRGSVFYACYCQILSISEPLGRWFEGLLGDDKKWLEHSTWVVVLILMVVLMLIIDIYSVEETIYIQKASVYMVFAASAIGVLLQQIGIETGISKLYQFVVAICFLTLEIITYFLFYILNKESKMNEELLAFSHKRQLSKELLQTQKNNLESMHMIRHEMKNHLAYIRVLLAKEEYNKLFDYTNSVLGQTEEMFDVVSSGNMVIDAVLNNAIQKAKKLNIEIETRIIVPEVLPFEEIDLCSILSNLTQNAIEAASVSGQKNAKICVDIQPRQDYLFIRVTNPYNQKLSKKKILSLKTTKENTRLHGYGTKVVKKIVEKYKGSIKFDISKGIFISDVMLDLNIGE